MERANPFGDLGDFAPKAQPKPVQPEQIDRLATDNNFPSRQPAVKSEAAPPAPAHRPRRHVTGRNRQFNVRASAETVERFYEIADRRRVTLAELFELAVAALEKQETQAPAPSTGTRS